MLQNDQIIFDKDANDLVETAAQREPKLPFFAVRNASIIGGASPITDREVFRRIVAGFRADTIERAKAYRGAGLQFQGGAYDRNWELDPAARETDLADDFASPPAGANGQALALGEVLGDGSLGEGFVNQSYAIRPTPTRKRRTDYTVRDDNVISDTGVTDWIERLRRWFLATAEEDPSWIETAFAAREEADPIWPADQMADLQAHQALGWLVEREAEGSKIEDARKLFLKWMRASVPHYRRQIRHGWRRLGDGSVEKYASRDPDEMQPGMTQAEFCEAEGIHRTKLWRAINTYCEARAVRLNKALDGPAAPIPSRDLLAGSEAVAIGIDQIADVTGRKPASILRSIQAGTFPAAKIDGEWVAFTQTISKAVYRKKTKAPAEGISAA